MPAIEISVRRFSVVSARPFEQVVRALTATVGRPDIVAFHRDVAAAKTLAALQRVVRKAIGPSELMEFARYDAGEILRKEAGGSAPNILRLVVGNPLIMKEMARTSPDAAAYAPVTILVDERADGVHLSYDTLASLLSPYGDEPALLVAKDLDTKVEKLLESAATQADSGAAG